MARKPENGGCVNAAANGSAHGSAYLGDSDIQSEEEALAEAQKKWQATLGELQLQMTRATFDTWLRGSQVVDFRDNHFTVYVRHAYAVDWLQNRLLSVIERTLRRRAGSGARVVFTARASEEEEQLVLVPEALAAGYDGTPAEQAGRSNGRASSTLNPSYTFERFVVGSSNRLAHAASRAVAENPAHAYNPLFLYGGVGLGKTHLLHALGHEAQSRGMAVL
jgi:chromosomal replication initiator protein